MNQNIKFLSERLETEQPFLKVKKFGLVIFHLKKAKLDYSVKLYTLETEV